MSWHEQVQAGLPSPRDGEPSDLRRDIADELGDHLACALQRERTRTDDESTAYKSVIRRFGDPIRIANRLWFDAMKETIMNQRIGLVTNVVLAVACIAIAFVAFGSLKQSTALSDALLTKLESIGAGTETKNSASVWAEATIPVLVDDKPAVDYLVTLRGDAFNPAKSDSLSDRTSEAGSVAFGPIRPGRYSLQVEDPSSGLRLSTDAILYPGQNDLDPVSLPALKPELATISFALDLQERIKDRIAFVRLSYEKHLPEHGAHNNQWHWPSLEVLLRPDGTVAQLRNIPLNSRRVAVRGTGTEKYIDTEALEQRRTIELDGAMAYQLTDIVVYLTIPDEVDRFAAITLPLLQQRLGRADSRYIKPLYFAGLHTLRASSTQENAWSVEIPDWLFQAVSKHIADSDRIAERSRLGPKPQ